MDDEPEVLDFPLDVAWREGFIKVLTTIGRHVLRIATGLD